MRCAYCGRPMSLREDGTLGLVERSSFGTTLCRARTPGYEPSQPHVEESQWLVDGLNAYDGEDVWRDLILGLLTRDELYAVASGAGRFIWNGVEYRYERERGEWWSSRVTGGV